TKVVDNIAYVNVKKINSNSSVSNEQDILKYAQEDRDVLQLQIDTINPDVIFTSETTFKAYQVIYDLVVGDLQNVKQLVCKDQTFIYAEHQNLKIIKTYHPSYFALSQELTASSLHRLLNQ